MSWFQSGLGWAYLFLCLTLVWYGVSLLLSLAQWVFRKAGYRKVWIAMIKLGLSLALTRIVIWLGVNYPMI